MFLRRIADKYWVKKVFLVELFNKPIIIEAKKINYPILDTSVIVEILNFFKINL